VPAKPLFSHEADDRYRIWRRCRTSFLQKLLLRKIAGKLYRSFEVDATKLGIFLKLDIYELSSVVKDGVVELGVMVEYSAGETRVPVEFSAIEGGMPKAGGGLCYGR
jgi:hypothetical protein